MTNFFIDSGDRAVLEPLLASGLFRGVTTNPTLLESAGVANREIAELVAWLTRAGAEQVFVQAWGADSGALQACGEELAELGDNVVVKVPATADGLRATAGLAARGIPVLVTAVYNASQVLPTIASGAQFIAPYLGRMNDAGRNGAEEIARMQRTIDASGSSLRILVASLRSARDAVALAELGVKDFTLAPGVWADFFSDPLTTAAVQDFEGASARGGELSR